MCGIIGLLVRDPAERSLLGSLIVPMFDCMAERGPDSAGLAVFGEPASDDRRRYSLFAPGPVPDWQDFVEELQRQTGVGGAITARDNHAELASAIDPAALRACLAEFRPRLELLGVGRQLDVYKDVGHPMDVARRYAFADLAGSHCVGHTRMATESAVSPAHAHPFTAGEDFCLVHNGSLSNPYMLRRQLEAEGLHFETDNDSEAACRLIEWHLRRGEGDVRRALEAAIQDLDGFYTLLVANARQLTLVRDAFACKPAVVAETERYVAISSEFRSLAHLPGISVANIFEPLPEVIYSWNV
ncbi:MAG TPA: class II glutamine amidotransferase [Pirellulales bacterium]|nr:class II glutamine amidotransferase [Pirellulales bacterium]